MLMAIMTAEAELLTVAIELGKLLIAVAVVAGTIWALSEVYQYIDEVAQDEYER